MVAQSRLPVPDHSRRDDRARSWRGNSGRVLLALFSVLLVAALACGTDRGSAAPAFQAEGETLSWSPQWDEGDERVITSTSSMEFNDALLAQLEAAQAPGATLSESGLGEEQSATSGTVTIISKDSDGSTARFDVSIEELIRQIQGQSLEQPGFGEADLEGFTAIMGLLGNIDLGVEFEIGNSGAVVGVTNTDELVETVQDIFDSFLRLAALAGDDTISPEDRQKFEDALDALPDTELARVFGEIGLHSATANMFLMRSGEYTVGQPVVVTGTAPTFIGVNTDGAMTYEVTDISDDTVTVDVLVSPAEFDVLAMVERLAAEVETLIGEDADGVSQKLADLDADERAMIEALTPILFEPYTVTLTIDAATGWVTAADWSVELSLPEGFEDLIPEEDRDFEDDLGEFELSDFGVILNTSATFEEPVDN